MSEPLANVSCDGFNHSITIGKHLVIPESNHREPLRIQISRAFEILRRVLCVLPAINFDDQARGQANEIHDVGTEGKLATKPDIVNLL